MEAYLASATWGKKKKIYKKATLPANEIKGGGLSKYTLVNCSKPESKDNL